MLSYSLWQYHMRLALLKCIFALVIRLYMNIDILFLERWVTKKCLDDWCTLVIDRMVCIWCCLVIFINLFLCVHMVIATGSIGMWDQRPVEELIAQVFEWLSFSFWTIVICVFLSWSLLHLVLVVRSTSKHSLWAIWKWFVLIEVKCGRL